MLNIGFKGFKRILERNLSHGLEISRIRKKKKQFPIERKNKRAISQGESKSRGETLQIIPIIKQKILVIEIRDEMISRNSSALPLTAP